MLIAQKSFLELEDDLGTHNAANMHFFSFTIVSEREIAFSAGLQNTHERLWSLLVETSGPAVKGIVEIVYKVFLYLALYIRHIQEIFTELA
jgi:hypothetical protein